MIKKLFHWFVGHQQGSAAAVITLSSFALLTKFLALVQQALTARLFGVSPQTDAYFVAQGVPVLMGGLMASSVSTALTRDFSRESSPDRVRGLLLLVTLGALVCSAFLALTSGPAVWFTGPGLSGATRQMAVFLARLMSFLFVFFSVTGVMQAYCYAQAIFVVPAIASLLPYAGGILGAYLLGRPLGIQGLVVGYGAGLAMQAATVSAPFLFRQLGHSQSPAALPASRASATGFVRSLTLVFLSLVVSQIYFITDRSLASTYGPGLAASFGFAASIFSLPLQLVVLSVSNALLPSLSRLVSEKRLAELARKVESLIWIVAFLIVPLALLLLLGSTPMTQLLYEGNAFDPTATAMTAAVLQGYSLGLIGFAFKDIATSILLACNLEKWPALVGMICIVANLGAAWALGALVGHLGIAYATTGIFLFNAAALLALISRKLALSWRVGLKRSGWKIALAAITLVAVYALSRQAMIAAPGRLLGLGIEFGRLGLAALSYLAVCWLLGLPELQELLARYAQPLKRMTTHEGGAVH